MLLSIPLIIRKGLSNMQGLLLNAIVFLFTFSAQGKPGYPTPFPKNVSQDYRALCFWVYNYKGADEEADFESYAQYLERYSHWPNKTSIVLNGEKLILSHVSDRKILSWFVKHPPRTLRGVNVYIRGLQRAGLEIRKLVLDTWHHKAFDRLQDLEAFRTEHSSVLSPEDHKKRFINRVHQKDFQGAQQVLPYCSNQDQKILGLYLKLRRLDRDVRSEALSVKTDRPDLLNWAVLRYLAMREIPEAPEIFLRYRSRVQALSENEDSYVRQRLARYALAGKNYDTAYKVLSRHPFQKGANFEGCEFFLGWISSHHLNQPRKAIAHFQRLYKGVQTPLSKAKAAYWAAQAYRQCGDQDNEVRYLKRATQAPQTFYGILAIHTLGKNLKDYLGVSSLKKTNKVDISGEPEIRYAHLLHKWKLYPGAKRFLILSGLKIHDTQKQHAFLSYLTQHFSYAAVPLAKYYSRKKPILNPTAYPQINPNLLQGLEPAFVNAIIRQESDFDQSEVSRAHAYGLMQVILPTAKFVSEEFQVPYEPLKIIEDPDHNVRMGGYYLRYLQSKMRNVQPLIIAAYNAGPTPVMRWVETFGYPDKENLANWVESIPYEETRTYVKRVLANYWVYQSL